jgi:signal transduction histidine kinase
VKARLAVLGGRLRSPLGRDRRSLSIDIALAGAFAVAAALINAQDGDFARRTLGPTGWDLALAAPLVLCRRRPVTAVLFLGAVSFLQWLYGVPAAGDVAILFALYVLGLRERRVRVLAVLICGAQTGVVLATVRWHPGNLWINGFLLSGTVTASWVLGVYTRTRLAYIASIRERAESAERDRDARAQIAVATERARIAREMHDVIAHSISVMITLNDAAVAIGPPGRQREAIAQASEVGRQALDEMHRMLGILRTGDRAELAPQPGVGDLTALVAAVRSAGPEVRLTLQDGLDRVGATAQLAVYRIVQESLTNVLKHARQARHVTVDVRSTATRIDITVRDDGVVATHAPAPPRSESATGHGISVMRERASLFDGRIEAGPRPDGGWQTTATLALTETGSH